MPAPPADTLKNLQDALLELKREPGHPVRARVGDLTLEIRVVPDRAAGRSAAQIFAGLGAWAGESTEEITGIVAGVRDVGGRRDVRGL